MNRYSQKLEEIHAKVSALYQGFMGVSAELAELIKATKGLTEDELKSRARERGAYLAAAAAGEPAQAESAGDPELGIF